MDFNQLIMTRMKGDPRVEERLRKLLESEPDGNRKMEILATLHYMKRRPGAIREPSAMALRLRNGFSALNPDSMAPLWKACLFGVIAGVILGLM